MSFVRICVSLHVQNLFADLLDSKRHEHILNGKKTVLAEYVIYCKLQVYIYIHVCVWIMLCDGVVAYKIRVKKKRIIIISHM